MLDRIRPEIGTLISELAPSDRLGPVKNRIISSIIEANPTKDLNQIFKSLAMAGTFRDSHIRVAECLFALVKFDLSKLSTVEFYSASGPEGVLISTVSGTQAIAANCLIVKRPSETGFIIGPDNFEFIKQLLSNLKVKVPGLPRAKALGRDRETDQDRARSNEAKIPDLTKLFAPDIDLDDRQDRDLRDVQSISRLREILSEAKRIEFELMASMSAKEIVQAAQQISRLSAGSEGSLGLISSIERMAKKGEGFVPEYIVNACRLLREDEEKSGLEQQKALTADQRAKLLRTLLQFNLRTSLLPSQNFFRPLSEDIKTWQDLDNSDPLKGVVNGHAMEETALFIAAIERDTEKVPARKVIETLMITPIVSFRRAYNRFTYQVYGAEFAATLQHLPVDVIQRLPTSSRKKIEFARTIYSAFSGRDSFYSILSSASFKALLVDTITLGRLLSEPTVKVIPIGHLSLIEKDAFVSLSPAELAKRIEARPDLVADGDRGQILKNLPYIKVGVVPKVHLDLFRRYSAEVFRKLIAHGDSFITESERG